METAQRMVLEYSASKGYEVDDEYPMEHQAPNAEDDPAAYWGGHGGGGWRDLNHLAEL